MLLPYWTNGPHRVDGGPLLRVRGDDAVPLHDRRAAVGPGQRVEPGARARLPHDRRTSTSASATCSCSASATTWRTRPRRRRRPTRTRTSSWSRRCRDRDGAPPTGWNIYEVKGSDDGRAAARTSRSSSTPHAGHPVRVLRPRRRSPGSSEAGARGVGVHGRAAGGTTPRRSTGRSRPAGPTSWAAGAGREAEHAPKQPLPPVKVTQHPPDRRLGLVPRVADRRPGRGADVLLPELGGERRRGPVAAHAELHGRGADVEDVTLHYARSGAEIVGIALSRRRAWSGSVGLVVWRPTRSRATSPWIRAPTSRRAAGPTPPADDRSEPPSCERAPPEPSRSSGEEPQVPALP